MPPPPLPRCSTAVSHELKTWRALPSLRFITDYHQHEHYIAALAHSLEEHWQAHGRSEKLVMSFHGIPQQSTVAGDPYAAQCHTTAKRLAEKLKLTDDQWLITFQSRFGPKKWLQPYTEVTLKQLAEHTPNVDIICPGFAADCLETLEEIQMRYQETFIAAGGETLNYIPALNDREDHLDMMMAIIKANISGWRNPTKTKTL